MMNGISFAGKIDFDPDFDLDNSDKDYCINLIRETKVASLKRRDSTVSHEILQNMSISYVMPINSNKSFVIGSLPIVKLTPFDSSALNDKRCEVLFPISKDICIYLNNYQKEGTFGIDSNFVRKINLSSWKQSREIASHSDVLIKSIINNK